MWEMAQIYGKWLQYLINGLNMYELTQRFLKMAKNAWKMAQIHEAWLKYFRYGKSVLQMT